MTQGWRRLNDADAMYVGVDEAVPGEFTPLSLTVYDRGFPDEDAVEHLTEVMSRLLPALRCRLKRDLLSTALPRWVDVPDFDLTEHMFDLPAPGDGSLRAVLDWAAEWGEDRMPRDRPPWRFVYFRDVEVDGVGGRMVSIGQIHHTVIDGEGGKRMAERFLQWGPDEPMPEMPELEPPDETSAFASWREGWGIEGRKIAGLLRGGARRAGFVVRHPVAGGRRVRELAAAVRRFNASTGTETLSPQLKRQSTKLRLDLLEVDIKALRAGARAAGGSVNDGLLAAMSLALGRWHREQGVQVPEIRTTMAMNTRPDDGSYGGNDITAVMIRLPLFEDDAAKAVAACREVSAAGRGDADMLKILDWSRKLANRGPAKMFGKASAKRMAGIDLGVSNVNGIPSGYWLGGVENLRTVAFASASWTALNLILGSVGDRADLGITSCPVAIPDADHLVALMAEAFAEVSALAG